MVRLHLFDGQLNIALFLPTGEQNTAGYHRFRLCEWEEWQWSWVCLVMGSYKYEHFCFFSFIYLSYAVWLWLRSQKNQQTKMMIFLCISDILCVFFLRYQDPQGVIVLLRKVGEISASLGVFFFHVFSKDSPKVECIYISNFIFHFFCFTVLLKLFRMTQISLSIAGCGATKKFQFPNCKVDLSSDLHNQLGLQDLCMTTLREFRSLHIFLRWCLI